MFEAQRWHSDPRLFSPMMVLDSGKHLFIGDFITLEDDPKTYGKVIKFAIQVNTETFYMYYTYMYH